MTFVITCLFTDEPANMNDASQSNMANSMTSFNDEDNLSEQEELGKFIHQIIALHFTKKFIFAANQAQQNKLNRLMNYKPPVDRKLHAMRIENLFCSGKNSL